MSLLTYDEARPWAESIRLELASGHMPPWFGDGKSGPFANDSSLSARDKADVLAWIKARCPAGDAKDAPLPVLWEKGWKIGKPDLESLFPKQFGTWRLDASLPAILPAPRRIRSSAYCVPARSSARCAALMLIAEESTASVGVIVP